MFASTFFLCSGWKSVIFNQFAPWGLDLLLYFVKIRQTRSYWFWTMSPEWKIHNMTSHKHKSAIGNCKGKFSPLHTIVSRALRSNDSPHFCLMPVKQKRCHICHHEFAVNLLLSLQSTLDNPIYVSTLSPKKVIQFTP